MKKGLVPAVLLGLTVASIAAPALAQPPGGGGSAEVRDDMRDLRRFEQLARDFDQAMNQRNADGIRNSISAFVRAGRAEVTELQNEVRRAQQAGGRPGARRRNFASELSRLQRANSLVQQLERTGQAEVNFGPRRRVLQQARTIMTQFIGIAREELRASQLEEIRR